MKRIYFLLGLVMVVGTIYFLGFSSVFGQAFNPDAGDCFMTPADVQCKEVIYSPKSGGGGGSLAGSTTTPAAPVASGVLSITPSYVKDAGVFSIKLSGAENVPAGTATHLWIDTDNSGSFKNFGSWLSVGALKAGIQRTMNCSSYSSYDPSGPQNVVGKILNQRLFISYDGLGYGSEIAAHTKDCSAASGGGSVPPTGPTGGSTGPATCSVTPASASIGQNGTLDFKVSSNRQSGEHVFVTAKDFQPGMFSDASGSKTIFPGSNSVGFKVYTLSTANPGKYSFKVYCATSCPVSGCPSGGAPEVIGEVPISVTVTGVPVSGGGAGGSSGSASCSVPDVSLAANSSALVPIKISRNATFTGSSNQNVSITPVYPRVDTYDLGRRTASAIVSTGPSFSGGSYSLTCAFNDGTSVVATGNATLPVASNSSGKIKFSQVKYLNETLFPRSECSFDVPGCQNGFSENGPKILDASGNPALIGADMVALNPGQAKGNSSTARYFSLSDPMNPLRVDSNAGPKITTEDASGDFGPALRGVAVAYSKDLAYRALTDSQGSIYISNPTGTRYRTYGFYARGQEVQSIVKSGSNYMLLTSGNDRNITNLRNDSLGSVVFDNYPANFPRLGAGKKIVSADDAYITFVDVQADQAGLDTTPKIKLYSTSQANSLAEFDIPADLQAYGRVYAGSVGNVSFPGGEYIYGLRSGTDANVRSQNWKLDIFKVDYGTKTISLVSKGISLPTGYPRGPVAFDTGSGNTGIIMFMDSADGVSKGTIKAFLMSDLINGRAVDVLSNSPAIDVGEGGVASSFSRGGATYVYSSDIQGYNVKVWKFESGTGSSGDSNPPSVTPPTGGGAPTYDCNFDLTFTPTNLTVQQGTYYANYTIKANSTSINPFCTINIIPPSQNNIKSDFVNTLVVSPNGQASMLLNVSKAVSGSYDLPVKAAAKGIPIKTYTVKLTIQ